MDLGTHVEKNVFIDTRRGGSNDAPENTHPFSGLRSRARSVAIMRGSSEVIVTDRYISPRMMSCS